MKFGKPTNGEVLDNPVLDTNDQSINHDELLARLNELEKLEQEESQLEHNTMLENIMAGKYQKTSTRPKDNFAHNGYKDLANEKSISHHVQRSLDESILESSKRVKFRADVPIDQVTSREEDQCYDTNVITFSHTSHCQVKILGCFCFFYLVSLCPSFFKTFVQRAFQYISSSLKGEVGVGRWTKPWETEI